MAEEVGFFSRWSRRKSLLRDSTAQPSAPSPETQTPHADLALQPTATAAVNARAVSAPQADRPPPEAAQGAGEAPLPTLDDVAALTSESDFSRFVARGVQGDVRNAALKKLFSDPHFNVMDGLDTYIDDYSQPSPLPRAMLRQMAQSAYLGLTQPDPAQPQGATELNPSAALVAPADAKPSPTPAESLSAASSHADASSAPAKPLHDEDPDLRLQSLHALGPPGLDTSAAGHERGQR